MRHVLHHGDWAYWWDHPGLLLWIKNAPKVMLDASGARPDCMGHLGTTRLEAYKAAASFHTSLAHMATSVATHRVFVVYWCWTVSDQEWTFHLEKLRPEDVKSARH